MIATHDTYQKVLFKSFKVCLIFIAAFHNHAFSQFSNVWLFGDHAGIDFNSGSPVEITNSNMFSFEGCASMCDSSGNLLMYTNGGPVVTAGLHGAVWNRFHNEMPNGDLDTCSGCNSAKQSSVFVPEPEHPGSYYLFTVGCVEYGNMDLHFSKIDMALDSGLGDLTVKDSLLFGNITETVTAIRHANGTDYWIIVRNWSGVFYYYLITAQGISGYYWVLPNPSVSGWNGYIVGNCEGSKLVVAGFQTYVYDFDNSTGIISNPVYIDSDSIYGHYGAAFSPSGRFLYLSRNQKLMQYDLTAPNVNASGVLISNGWQLAGMALAPDGKIYVARVFGDYLSTINYPDMPDTTCDFVFDSFPLSNESRYGLPNFVNTFTGGCQFTGQHDLTTLSYKCQLVPNPATNKVALHSDHKIYSIVLMDALGRQIIGKTFNQGVTQYTFDISSLDEGLYFILSNYSQSSQTLKLLKVGDSN
ncbi:hypothetical protein BH11BAC1_BH11BAC1_05110 [soil metagenome]